MEKIDRRNFLAVSSLALGLAACSKGEETKPPKGSLVQSKAKQALMLANPLHKAFGFLPDNFGLNPMAAHPGLNAKLGADGSQPPPLPQNQQLPFNPDHVAVFHFELIFEPAYASIKVQTAHFAAEKTGGNNWNTNQPNIAKVINHLNGTGPNPGIIIKKNMGFDELKFNDSHHLVIYIKNKGLSFFSRLPLIFGEKLLDGITDAEKNGSFFDCTIKQNIANVLQDSLGGCANEALHIKNFFHRYDDVNGVQAITDRQPHWHSMNFLTTLRADDDALLLIPVIFDPDTGNMGAGGGYP